MKNKLKSKFSLYKLIIGTILSVFAVSLFFVVYWGLVNALKTPEEFETNVMSIPGGAPWNWAWGNFIVLFENFFVPDVWVFGRFGDANLLVILFNTVIYSVGGALIATIVPCVVGYVTAKFDFKTSKVIYTAVIVIMVLPIVGNLPSMIAVMDTLGLYNTLYGALIQKAHFLNMYYLVFFATFKGVAKDYSEAAYLDGASEWRIFGQIMLPLVKTGFMTIMLIFFVEFWNDYQTPLLYMPDYPTLSYAVYNIINRTERELGNVPIRMVTCIVMVIPTLTLFLIFKNKMIGNLSMGGIKG